MVDLVAGDDLINSTRLTSVIRGAAEPIITVNLTLSPGGVRNEVTDFRRNQVVEDVYPLRRGAE